MADILYLNYNWSWAGREILHFFTISNMYIAPRHGHKTTCYKLWQHFKAFIIPISLYQFQKDPFGLIVLYNILLYFIHVCIAPGQGDTTHGDIFMEAEMSSLWSLVAYFQNISLPSDFMHIFHDFIHVYSLNRKASSLQPLILYTSFLI